MTSVEFPRANLLIATSRLHPASDGGYTIAAMNRARQLRDAGADPILLTVDFAADYDEHRDGFRRIGLADEGTVLRNLYEEARADPSWLIAAADPGLDGRISTGSITESSITEGPHTEHPDAAGRPLLRTPLVPRADWHRATDTITVYDDGEPVGTLAGFGALYRAWVNHVIAGLDPDLPTVIIAESRQVGELLIPLRDARTKLVHTVHNAHTMPPHEWDSPMDALWSGWIDTLAGYDAVTFPTARQRDDVIRRFGGPTRFEVIPSAVPAPRAEAPSPQRDPLLTVVVARLAPQKRVDRAIRAIAAVRQRGILARLDVYGDGPLRGELEALIDELQLRNAVRLLGYDPAVTERIGEASLLLLTSEYEGQSLVILEGFNRGTPAVAFDVNYGPSELIDEGVSGHLVPVGDIDRFADTIADVLSNPPVLAGLIDGARLSAERMSVAAVMERWRRLLTELVD